MKKLTSDEKELLLSGLYILLDYEQDDIKPNKSNIDAITTLAKKLGGKVEIDAWDNWVIR